MTLKTIDFTSQDPALGTLNVIRALIRAEVNTVILGEVVDTDGDKVSVQSLVIERDSTHPPVIFHNVPVFMIGGTQFTLEYPLSKGDQGILLTSKLDISEYKQTRKRSKTTLNRVFDKNDNLFIPVYYNAKNLKKEEVRIKFHNNSINLTKGAVEVKTPKALMNIKDDKIIMKSTEKINLESPNGEVELICNKVNLNCDELTCTPLKTIVDSIKDLMDSMALGMAGAGTNAAQYNAKKLEKETAKVWDGLN